MIARVRASNGGGGVSSNSFPPLRMKPWRRIGDLIVLTPISLLAGYIARRPPR
jgi:hypothetical protein